MTSSRERRWCFRPMATLGCCAALLGCPSREGVTVITGTHATTKDVARWETSRDGHVHVPLANGLSWEPSTSPPPEDLIKVGAPQGPTFVVAVVIDGAPTPIARESCAAAHRDRIIVALASKGIAFTTPQLTGEMRNGERVPRLDYAVPLQASEGVPPASLLSAWSYFVDRDRCIGVNATTMVHGKKDAPETPDPDDLQRLERVFDVVAEGTKITS